MSFCNELGSFRVTIPPGGRFRMCRGEFPELKHGHLDCLPGILILLFSLAQTGVQENGRPKNLGLGAGSLLITALRNQLGKSDENISWILTGYPQASSYSG